MSLKIVMRGGGDLSSGAALRLHHAGLDVLLTELPQPLMVRRKVSFGEAVYSKEVDVEGVRGMLVADLDEADICLKEHCIPVMVDPQAKIVDELMKQANGGQPVVVVDVRMLKSAPEPYSSQPDLVIGVGPGFTAGVNCHFVIESNRGHQMGRLLSQGSAEDDTGIPENTLTEGSRRVLRAPADGVLVSFAEIGDHLEGGQVVAEVGGVPVRAPFKGVLRGLLHPGLTVHKELKIGDVDPRDNPQFCYMVSDKSLAIGGAVLEAILSHPELRPHLWN